MTVNFNQKIFDSEDQQYFITSDLHFYHKNVINFCSEHRPFETLEQMHEYLINHWNSKVGKNDVIFHLGDFSFAAKEKTAELIEQLNGNIIWICGNHDLKVFNQLGIKYHHYLEVRYEGKKIVMCHYPIGSWNRQSHGSLHAHGHSHGMYANSQGKMHDVGWDNNGKILTLKEFVEIADSNEICTSDLHRTIRNEI